MDLRAIKEAGRTELFACGVAAARNRDVGQGLQQPVHQRATQKRARAQCE